jgi:voltage-gated potassium channel
MFIRFNIQFWRTIWHMSSVNLALLALISINSLAISYVEKLPFGDALYFALITGLTIGYGDIVVKTPVGRILAVLVGVIGVLFSGLVIAVAVRALRETYHESEKRD